MKQSENILEIKETNLNTHSDKQTKSCLLSVAYSVDRISHKRPENIKTTQKTTIEEVEEQLKETTVKIINLFYEMELSILKNSFIPLETGEKLRFLKTVNISCKKSLALPKPDELTLPEEFIDEYKGLFDRTVNAIDVIKSRIKRLKQINGKVAILEMLEKNLLTLIMLRSHYIHSLFPAEEY